MGYMSEIAGNLPEEYLNDNLIFKCLVTKQIEESDAKPDSEFYHFFNNILLDIPPRRKLMYHMYVSEDKKTYPFLVMALFTGMRRGEMMALEWSNVKFEEGLLIVNKNRTGTKSAVTKKITTPKSESSNRRIPIHPALIEVLKAEKARQDDLKKYMGKSYPGGDFVVLSTDMKPYSNLSAINRVVNRLIKGAGLPHTTIHGLRHAVATVLDDQGTSIRDISVLLGHKSVQTTEKIYIDRIRKAKKENIEALGSVINI